MHIRINKRVFERAIFAVVVVALAAFAFLQPEAPVEDNSDELTGMQIRIDELVAENEKLGQNLEESNRQLQAEREAAKEREAAIQEEVKKEIPKEEGDIEVAWSAQVGNDGRLSYLSIELVNNKFDTQELLYTIYWDGLSDKNKIEKTEVVRSENIHHEVLLQDGKFEDGVKNIPTLPSEHITTLIFRVETADGILVDQLEKTLR